MSHLSFLPTDPISFLWCSVEQEINLAWPNGCSEQFALFCHMAILNYCDLIILQLNWKLDTEIEHNEHY